MILADPRYGSERGKSSHRAVVDALRKLDVPVESAHLDFGDFMFIGNGPDGPFPVGVELKAVSDFVTSMRSGRLREQIAGMLDTYKRVYALIEGPYRARRGAGILEIPRGKRWRPVQAGPRPVFWTDVERFIAGLEEAGVRVRYPRTTEQTARTIWHVLYGFWDKPYDAHTSLQGTYHPQAPLELVREDPDTKRARLVACCLPGIGWGRSKAVVEAFGSIERMGEASVEDWTAVPGIGNTIAAECYRAIRATVHRAQTPPTRVVPERPRAAARSVRHSRLRQDEQLDAGQRAQRRVSQARMGRRKAR